MHLICFLGLNTKIENAIFMLHYLHKPFHLPASIRNDNHSLAHLQVDPYLAIVLQYTKVKVGLELGS